MDWVKLFTEMRVNTTQPLLEIAAQFFAWVGNLQPHDFKAMHGESWQHYFEKLNETNRNGSAYFLRLDAGKRVMLKNHYYEYLKEEIEAIESKTNGAVG